MADKAKSEAKAGFNHDEDGVAEKNHSQQPEALEATFDAIGGAPNPWGRGHLHLYGLCLLIYLCSTMNGKSLPLRTAKRRSAEHIHRFRL